jgi:hypothetical protein
LFAGVRNKIAISTGAVTPLEIESSWRAQINALEEFDPTIADA